MVRVGTILFLDCEIIREVPWPDQERMPGVEYCEGWQDFTGMGIACVGVIEAKLWSTSQPYGFRGLEIRGARVFGTGYLDSLPDHLNRHAGVVTFNGLRFDLPLLAAHGVELLPETPHLDLAREIWDAAGIEDPVLPRGLGLNALCRANHIPGKTGHGAEAPRQWQRGEHCRVIDYCLQDCLALIELFRAARSWGQLTDPRQPYPPGPRQRIQLDTPFRGVFA